MARPRSSRDSRAADTRPGKDEPDAKAAKVARKFFPRDLCVRHFHVGNYPALESVAAAPLCRRSPKFPHPSPAPWARHLCRNETQTNPQPQRGGIFGEWTRMMPLLRSLEFFAAGFYNDVAPTVLGSPVNAALKRRASRSDGLTVAVGFIPRLGFPNEPRHGVTPEPGTSISIVAPRRTNGGRTEPWLESHGYHQPVAQRRQWWPGTM